MTSTGRSVATQRLWPRRLRTRLALTYAVVLLLAGTALLAVTYALVETALLPAPVSTNTVITPHESRLLELCKHAGLPGRASMPASLRAQCDRTYAAVGSVRVDQRAVALAALRTASAIGLGLLAILSAAFGWWLSKRALRPVRAITEAARRASELQLGPSLSFAGGDDELNELADTFDVMLQRLDGAFTSQKRFVANAAHELRTPLTAMRTAIEVTLSKPTRTPEQLEAMAGRVKRGVEQAEATIEALLTLATSELGPRSEQTVDLVTATEDALDALHAAIDQRQITVQSTLEPAHVRGDPVLLERMIANLVDNAVRHNHSGGWIAIRTSQADDQAAFEITNTGPDISAEQIPALFEAFTQAEQRLNHAGVGLGLSIAHTIAHAHNAAITACPRPGGGLQLLVAIPTSPG